MVSIFSAPLATPAQLSSSPSQQSGLPDSLEQKLHLVACRLIQAAGILMELPQPTISTAIILLQRFYILTSLQTSPILPTSLASLYLSSKITEHPRKPRDLINIFKYLLSPASPLHPPHLRHPSALGPSKLRNTSNKNLYYVSEGDYTALRSLLLSTEARILRTLGFDTTVQLPYTLAFNYLQSLGVLSTSRSDDDSKNNSNKTPAQKGGGREGGELYTPLQHDKLVSTTFAYLTDLLASPSKVYLTHHPHEIAVAGIYIAARDHGVKLPERWWEVWDVERETLGFLMVVIRAGTYNTDIITGDENKGGGKVWIVEEGEFEEEVEGGGMVVAIGRESVEREVERLRSL
ncbi:Cyclin-L2 [Arthrobotrys entomopaga]|nr:Cyclin-L2 [Arthrobotrys entomopaga]